MNTLMKKIGNAVLAVAMIVALGASAAYVTHRYESAPAVHALGTDVIRTFSGSINTEATVITGATGTKLHVYAMDLSSSGAGVVVFKDGTGGTTILNVYCAANTPRTLYDIFGSNGLVCTQNILTATLAGATLTTTSRCQDH